MFGNARAAVLANIFQIFGAAFGIGNGDNLPVCPQPLCQMNIVQSPAVLIPTGGISPTETEKNISHRIQRQIVTTYLKIENGQIQVVEKVDIQMHDMQIDRFIARSQGQAQIDDVLAPINVNWRITRRTARKLTPGTPLTVEKALDVGEKRDELAIMALLELRRISGEFVVEPGPRQPFHRSEDLPVPPLGLIGGERLQLQRPDQAAVKQLDLLVDLPNFSAHDLLSPADDCFVPVRASVTGTCPVLLDSSAKQSPE
jgi:hypothetical protein